MPPANPAVCTTLQRGVTFNYLPTRPVPEEDKHFPEGRPTALRNALPTKPQPQHGGRRGALQATGADPGLGRGPLWELKKAPAALLRKPCIVANDFLALALLPEARRGLQTSLTSGPP